MRGTNIGLQTNSIVTFSVNLESIFKRSLTNHQKSSKDPDPALSDPALSDPALSVCPSMPSCSVLRRRRPLSVRPSRCPFLRRRSSSVSPSRRRRRRPLSVRPSVHPSRRRPSVVPPSRRVRPAAAVVVLCPSVRPVVRPVVIPLPVRPVVFARSSPSSPYVRPSVPSSVTWSVPSSDHCASVPSCPSSRHRRRRHPLTADIFSCSRPNQRH